MKVWLAGAGGRLGSALRARIEDLGVALVATSRELDISDRHAVDRFVERERPALIVNAAGYTRVDDAEIHATEAFGANAVGPENLGAAAARSGASILHFSTEFVFDGRATAPYREDAQCAPAGVYAESKYEGEQRLFETMRGRSLWLVRTSWLFADSGASFVRRILELVAERDEVRVVADQSGRPTYAPDLADAALRLVGLAAPERHPASARSPGVYHFANRGAATRHALAEAVRERARAAKLSVRAARIVPIATSEYPLPAARPAYGVLDTAKIEAALGLEPRGWEAALDEFFAKLR